MVAEEKKETWLQEQDGGRRSSTTSVSSSMDPKTPRILRKKIDKARTMMEETEQTEKKGRNSKQYKRLSDKLQKYQTELEEITTTPAEEEEEDEPAQEKDGATRRSSTASVITGSPADFKSPQILLKKISKVQIMMEETEQQEKKGRDSKQYKRLSDKLEQYQVDLEQLIPAEEQEEGTEIESVPLPPITPSTPSLSKTKEKMGISASPPASVPPPVREEDEADRRSSATSASATPPADYKSPQILRKKIAKVQTMMEEAEQSERKGRESKPYRRLSAKLEKYEGDLGQIVAEQKLLKKKLKKVDKRMEDIVREKGAGAFKTKDFKKLLKKREEYETVLEATGETVYQAKKEQQMQLTTPPTPTPPLPATENKEELKAETAPPPPLLAKVVKAPPRRSKRVSATPLHELNEEFEPPVFKKGIADKFLISTELKRSFVFQKTNEESLDKLSQAFEPTAAYAAGDIIIQQGDVGDYLYIIKSGVVDYEVHGNTVGSAKQGASFGELALLYNCPRAATVRAASTTKLFRVDQTTFRYILQSQHKFSVTGTWKTAVGKAMAMNRLLDAGALTKMLQEDDECIVEGKDGEEEEQSCEGSKGLEDVPRVKRDEEQLQSDDDSVEFENFKMRRKSSQSFMKSSRVSMDNFNRESILGEGQFGEVWMVKGDFDQKDLQDKDFALKIQSKNDMTRMSQGNTCTASEAIKRECDILSELTHPFIVEFIHYFEDEENIYLVMGVIKGEELWSVLHKEDENGDWHSGMIEADAKFYGLLVADTMNFMHKQKICYRDLKPENIMIDQTGYPIIVDFGFAKYLPDDITFTFCGTPNYTCPEIISNQGHGYGADHWALGVVIYEMISGENPFYYDGISSLKLLGDITSADPEPLGDKVSAEAKDIVQKLLVKDREKRLGSLENMGKDILMHPFFADVDLSKARKKQIPAPWLPLPPEAEDEP